MFADRTDAGNRLAEAVAAKGYADPVLLALPRGGVPVAAIVAERLGCPLDLVLVRKIGAPGHEELAVAAVADGPREATDRHVAVNQDVLAQLGRDRGWVDARADEQMAEIRRRRRAYLGERRPVSVAGKTAIVVDDGIATGATTRVALQAVREADPARLVLAVPVAPPDTVAALREVCDEVVCLETPASFGAIGLFYDDFHQVPDEEVIAALDRAAARGDAATG
jgi:putative phosphoribosyl transferase